MKRLRWDRALSTWWGVGLWIFASGSDAAAAQPAVSISEEEVLTYVEKFYQALNSCDAEWVSEQFLEGSQIRFIYSDGSAQVLTPNEYLQRFQERCQTHQYVQWDRVSLRIVATGGQASVTWQLFWGQHGKKRGQPSRLLIHDQTRLGRCGWTVCIAGIEERMEELVPGAEQEYWAHQRQPGLLEAAVRFQQALIEALQGRFKPRTPEASR